MNSTVYRRSVGAFGGGGGGNTAQAVTTGTFGGHGCGGTGSTSGCSRSHGITGSVNAANTTDSTINKNVPPQMVTQRGHDVAESYDAQKTTEAEAVTGKYIPSHVTKATEKDVQTYANLQPANGDDDKPLGEALAMAETIRRRLNASTNANGVADTAVGCECINMISHKIDDHSAPNASGSSGSLKSVID
ncbi:uncharacterized protein LOC118745654 [Rhagoletis pomonella]|uniref:uncharacterized protein LOC118745654 n=1 Tax=Rhagoletis pomonella TaxID=28610 RepID=UPI00177D17E0|nr:uncharacterized protein LOC118745654 [Rhagoletis pomonella]